MGVLDRLKRRREFLVVAGQGRRWAAPGLILQARPRDPAPVPPDLAAGEPPAAGPVTPGPASPGPAAASASGSPTTRKQPGRPLPDRDAIRLGFTVSRKVGNAVVRNRVRRRLKAAAAMVFPDHARLAYDYVIIGRQQTMTRPFPALLQDMEIALRKVGAHRGRPDGASPANTGAKGTA